MTRSQDNEPGSVVDRILAGVVPAARRATEREVRREVKAHHGLVGLGFSVPHGHGVVLPQVVLVAEPPEELLEEGGEGAVARWLWQRLFELRVEAAVLGRVDQGTLTAAALRSRIHHLGETEFDEIRSVLRAQQRLLPPRPEAPGESPVYAAFVAAFHRLHRFDPARLLRWFPSLRGREAEILALVAMDADAPSLLRQTRPPGVEDPEPGRGDDADADVGGALQTRPSGPAARRSQGRRWLAKARGAAQRGNDARALRLAALAGQQEARDDEGTAASLAADALDRLAHRLATLTAPEGPDAACWVAALTPLVDRGSEGFERAESRFLYDLQRACLARERPAERVDLWAWIRSVGRRPVRRPLPLDPWLAPCRVLARAVKRLPRIRLPRRDRERLQAAVRHAQTAGEVQLRDVFRGIVAPRLAPGMGGDSTVEALARERLVAELADRALARGFVGYADLRDAVARGDARLQDVPGVTGWLGGDALLRTDRALDAPAEGVYRAGEVYLRGLQRGSSLLFGTRVGRWLTRGLLLPAGGAYVILEGLQHLLGPLLGWLAGVRIHLTSTWALVGLAVFLLLLLNVPSLRHALGRALGGLFGVLWGGVTRGVTAAARALGSWRLLQRLWASRWIGAALDRVGRSLRRLRRLLPGLLRAVVGLFAWLTLWIQRGLFAVDEWLRFRPGQSRLAVAVKAAAGLLWSAVAWVVRLYVTVLIEPQVNPVKHFPVVTVSHKIILPMTFTITEIVRTPLSPLGPVLANAIAVATVFLLPGMFGFLVWELKENRKLYGANRAPALTPSLVGHHGETVVRLLRPGFHSGTVPKLFARGRRVVRRDARRGDERAGDRHEERLHHLREAVGRFVERDLLALWRRVEGPAPAVTLREVRLTSNRISVILAADTATATLTLVERAGALRGGLQDDGLLAALGGSGREPFLAAVAGFLGRAGVDALADHDAAPIPWETWRGAWEPDGAAHRSALAAPLC